MKEGKERLIIFAYGNPSRGDDALGPYLLQWLTHHCAENENITFVEDFQLQVEHALDLQHQDLALFIDASISCIPPFTFTPLYPQQDFTYTSHALHPASVLYVYQQTQLGRPPPAFLLSVRGETFELGSNLSPLAQNHYLSAVTFLKVLCETVESTSWQNIAISYEINNTDQHEKKSKSVF